jgi:hypothetical protein
MALVFRLGGNAPKLDAMRQIAPAARRAWPKPDTHPIPTPGRSAWPLAGSVAGRGRPNKGYDGFARLRAREPRQIAALDANSQSVKVPDWGSVRAKAGFRFPSCPI